MEDQLIIDIAWQIKPSKYLGWIVDPISQTSIGSLSPLQLVDGSVWLGSSHVCRLQMVNIELLYIYSHLRYSAIVPNIPMVGEAVGHISVEYENVKQ